MKFLVDAQLPKRLARFLNDEGYDALHTLDLPLKNRTPDEEINDISVQEERILVTKDADFVDSFLVKHRPYRLLLVTTGNIHNRELMQLFERNIERIAEGFESYDYVELGRHHVVYHM